MIAARAALASILATLLACAAPPPGPAPAAGGGPSVAVYVVAHELHSGIAFARAEIPPGEWPESGHFPGHDYLEVGWGDRDFYQGREQGLWGTLKAALWPTPSVLHVAGFRGPLASHFPDNEIVELALPADGFGRLVRYIHDTHDRGGAPVAAPIGSGLYADSRFYPARDAFHLFRTCNVWTAGALRAAGLPVRDAISLEGLMRQIRPLGKPAGKMPETR